MSRRTKRKVIPSCKDWLVTSIALQQAHAYFT